jgi:hypothetical protein
MHAKNGIVQVSILVATALSIPATTFYGQTVQVWERPSSVLSQPMPLVRRHLGPDPFVHISKDSLLASLSTLSAIGADRAWRQMGSIEEAAALAWMESQLGGATFLKGNGLKLERESFRLDIATQVWETGLVLRLGNSTTEVPADTVVSALDLAEQARMYDSDGQLNDSHRDAVEVDAPTRTILSASALLALAPRSLANRVALVDYTLLDSSLPGNEDADTRLNALLAAEPEALVLFTRFSNTLDQSHGFGITDSWLFYNTTTPPPPTLFARLEDLGEAGIRELADLAQVSSARVRWDVDVFSPGRSGNLIATIPGRDRSRALILGAHIDAINTPGALDDGSGSVVLLEVARAFERARLVPPVDLVLVWFGSEEAGLFGSGHFALGHQELLDRTVAMLEVDCLTYPLDGLVATLELQGWSYVRFADSRLPFPTQLHDAAALRKVATTPVDTPFWGADNLSFAGFDVPHADLIYMDSATWDVLADAHILGHLHDPYDTMDLARQVAGQLEDMAHIALTSAMTTGLVPTELRVTPPPRGRAVFVASHTEPVHMTPAYRVLAESCMALAWEGLDVDVVPYGTPVTAADLADARIVVALPVVDYSGSQGDPTMYDEAWTADEVAVFEAYAREGGLLAIVNSNYRFSWVGRREANEDALDANALSSRFGVVFSAGTLTADRAKVVGNHSLTSGVPELYIYRNSAVPFSTSGQVLAKIGTTPALALVKADAGEVLVLGDIGILAYSSRLDNHAFWLNLARYAKSR